MAAEKTPAKANAGDNIEQFGYKQELRRGMGLWDVVMYGVLFMVIIAPQSIFGSIQLNSHGMTLCGNHVHRHELHAHVR